VVEEIKLQAKNAFGSFGPKAFFYFLGDYQQGFYQKRSERAQTSRDKQTVVFT